MIHIFMFIVQYQELLGIPLWRLRVSKVNMGNCMDFKFYCPAIIHCIVTLIAIMLNSQPPIASNSWNEVASQG